MKNKENDKELNAHNDEYNQNNSSEKGETQTYKQNVQDLLRKLAQTYNEARL